MGKFAGFLKRAKNIVNKVATGIRKANGFWNEWVSKPAAGVLSILYPGSNNLTDKLLEVNDYINKGLDWVIDKTSDKKPIKIPPGKPNNDKPIPGKSAEEVNHNLNEGKMSVINDSEHVRQALNELARINAK